MNAPDKGLVFAGREPGLIPWTLLGFILLSACLHAFGFFIFQTIYPAAARMAPPPAQVGLLTPGTPEADAILRWIDSEDPALAARPSKAQPSPALTDLPYIPSYNTVHARPTMSSPEDQPLPDPEGVSGLDLVEVAASHPAPSMPPPLPPATTLSFSVPLTPDGPLPSFSSLHEAETAEIPPTTFLLGVSDKGEVRYVFLQDFSGDSDKSLDVDATAILQQVRFRPSTAPLTWGFATFYWGSSIASHPAPTPDASP